jgi:hypothetical protein
MARLHVCRLAEATRKPKDDAEKEAARAGSESIFAAVTITGNETNPAGMVVNCFAPSLEWSAHFPSRAESNPRDPDLKKARSKTRSRYKFFLESLAAADQCRRSRSAAVSAVASRRGRRAGGASLEIARWSAGETSPQGCPHPSY